MRSVTRTVRGGARRSRAVVVTAVLLLLGTAGGIASQIGRADAASTTLPGGRVLPAGGTLVSSDGSYELRMGADGDLTQNSLFGVSPIHRDVGDPYGNGYFGGGNADGGILVGQHVERIWHSGTGGHPGARAIMQDDGNLVVYSAEGRPLWDTGTAGHPGARVVVQPDANVVVYASDERPLWSNGRVSTTDSGGSGQTNVRNCPTVGSSRECSVMASVPDGTGVTMKCWTTSERPAYAELTSDKWFYVQVHDEARGDYYGFVNAPFVAHQIPTPRCIAPPRVGESVPAAPSVTAGTDPPPTAAPRATPPPASKQAAPPTDRPTPTATRSTSPSATSPPPPPEPQTTWEERSGSHGSPTFTDPHGASGEGPRIPAMTTVTVSCRVYAPEIDSANPDGWWYRIASSPWDNAYYAVSNTFWNGDEPGRTPYTHHTDWSVPVC
ncbi:hypothetical protein ACFWNR_06935 [Streptomyces virginiae]|uniref:hypothetical protein n=1 Tax=Streptomyces virginiae TaxID=1961 RepID=UPI003663DCAE